MPGLIGYLEKDTETGEPQGFLSRMADALEPESARFERYLLEDRDLGLGLVSLALPGVPHQLDHVTL